MKTSLLLAAVGKALVEVGPQAETALGSSSASLLMFVGLGGLALLTLRSERWQAANRRAAITG